MLYGRTGNGTEVGSFVATHGRDSSVVTPITALRCVNFNLAIAVQQDVVFASVQRRAMSTAVCRGVAGATVIGIEFDVLVPSVFYASTDSGDVLVFNMRARRATPRHSYATATPL